MSREDDRPLPVTAGGPRVRATYRRWGGLYARTVARLEAPSQRRALALLDRSLAGATTVDVGCGPGRTLAELARRAGPTGHAVGVDAAPSMLRAARRAVAGRRGERAPVSLALGDVRRLPVADGTADVVCAMDVLDLFAAPDLDRVLRECRRVLAADGRLCVTTMDRAAVPDSRFLRAYEWAYRRVPGFDRVGCRPIPVVEAVRAADFRVERTRGLSRAGVWPVTALVAAPAD